MEHADAPAAPAPSRAALLDAAVAGWAGSPVAEIHGSYDATMVDLDGDGLLDAIVKYSEFSQANCGSGGCNEATSIFRAEASGFRYACELEDAGVGTTTSVEVGSTRSNGWLDLVVRGLVWGDDAAPRLFSFDGTRYRDTELEQNIESVFRMGEILVHDMIRRHEWPRQFARAEKTSQIVVCIKATLAARARDAQDGPLLTRFHDRIFPKIHAFCGSKSVEIGDHTYPAENECLTTFSFSYCKPQNPSNAKARR